MTSFRILDTPETHLKTLRAYMKGLEDDRTKAAEILRASESMLAEAPGRADEVARWHEQLTDLRARLQHETSNRPESTTERAVIDQIERCISEAVTALPANLKDQYALVITEHQLAASRMEKLISEMVKLNNDIYPAIQKGSSV